ANCAPGNGDVATRVGRDRKALAAQDNAVPFYVACPVPTIDPATPDGASIPIEERAAREVTHVAGALDDGSRASVRIVPEGCAVANPAFDVTPARLVTALITERGICDASSAGLRAVLAAGARGRAR